MKKKVILLICTLFITSCSNKSEFINKGNNFNKQINNQVLNITKEEKLIRGEKEKLILEEKMYKEEEMQILNERRIEKEKVKKILGE